MATSTWQDGVGKRCGERGCKTSPNCGPEHPWWIKVQWKGDRKSGYGSASKFIAAGLWQDHKLPPQTRKEAKMLSGRVLTWLQQGKPMPERAVVASTEPELTVGGLLDAYYKKKPKVLKHKKSQGAFDSKVRTVRRIFGALPISEFQTGAAISEYVAESLELGRSIGTPNAVLATVLRPASNWGAAQDVPLITRNPFGKHRVVINRKLEETRTQRCTPDMEARLFDACELLSGPEYNRCGQTLADYITIAIDIGPRAGYEILGLHNRDIDWHTHRITFLKTKVNEETRLAPFNPKGRVAAILKRRRFAGPDAPVIAEYLNPAKGETKLREREVESIYRAWVHVVCLAFGVAWEQTGSGGRPTKETIAGYLAVDLQMRDFRHEFATWVGLLGVSDETAEFIQGHRRQTVHGRYKHEAMARATAEMAEKVWPRESERATHDEQSRKARA